MIYVEVIGTTSDELRIHLKEVCYLFLKHLNIYKKTIPLDISITLCRMEEQGHCQFNDDFTFPEIDISLRKGLKREELVLTLAHELVHARQFLRKQLKNEGRIQYWMGVESNNEEWEVEAYELEKQLYEEYLKWK
jgi:hypothetical protein